MEEIAKKEIEDRLIEFYNAYYTDQINDMYVAYPQKRSILINLKDLEKFDSELANNLLNEPDMVLPNAHSALTRLNPHPESMLTQPVYARFFGVDAASMPLIQDVGSEQIGKLLTLDSLIIKRSEIIPRVHMGVFKCSMCNTVVKVEVDRDNVPEICPQCHRRSSGR